MKKSRDFEGDQPRNLRDTGEFTLSLEDRVKEYDASVRLVVGIAGGGFKGKGAMPRTGRKLEERGPGISVLGGKLNKIWKNQNLDEKLHKMKETENTCSGN